MKDILNRYADLREYILKVGEKGSLEPIKPKELDMPNPDMQKCYRDIKKYNFHGNVVDYLSWLSVKAIVTLWDSETENIQKLEIKDTEKIFKILEKLIDIIKVHSRESNNVARIPNLAFKEISCSKSGNYIKNTLCNEAKSSMLFHNILSIPIVIDNNEDEKYIQFYKTVKEVMVLQLKNDD